MQDIAILFEDNHLLGIVKPVNIPTQADASGDEDLLNLLKEDLRHRYAKPGNVYLGLVHRLDRPVGGAMIFAKTSKAASRLSEAVRTRKLEKTYLAVVRGKPSPSEGRLQDTLLKDERTNTVAIVPSGTAGGKEAILEYKLVGYDADQNLSLVRIQLLTGRSHQIRVQLSGTGCPLYGDQKYGAGLNTPGEQLALWSVYVGFPHPVSKAPVDLTSLPPRLFPWSLWDERICKQAVEDSVAGGH